MQRYEKKNAHTNKLLHINQSHQFYFPPLALAMLTILMASLSHFLPLGGVRRGPSLSHFLPLGGVRRGPSLRLFSPSGELEGGLAFDLKEQRNGLFFNEKMSFRTLICIFLSIIIIIKKIISNFAVAFRISKYLEPQILLVFYSY